MDSTVTYKCPNCDAGLIFDPEKGKFVCEFCISDFTEDDLREKGAFDRTEQAEREQAEFSEHIKEYCCPSCGAEVIADENTVAGTCFYCHNPIVLSDKVSGNLKPSKIIPFAFDKEEAKARFLRFAKRKKFVPKSYAAPENAENISGVYYPFWVTDADTEADFDARGTKVRTWRMGNYRYTETSHYNIMRSGDIHFEDITTSAITEEDKAMLEGILPYPSDVHRDFSMPYLQGFVAKKRNIEREALSGEVRERMHGYASSLLQGTVHGYATVTDELTGIRISKSHWEYTLMPVWILNYKHKGKNYTYAMNGHTGKVYGELPISFPKLGILFGSLFSAVALICTLIGYFLM